MLLYVLSNESSASIVSLMYACVLNWLHLQGFVEEDKKFVVTSMTVS